MDYTLAVKDSILLLSRQHRTFLSELLFEVRVGSEDDDEVWEHLSCNGAREVYEMEEVNGEEVHMIAGYKHRHKELCLTPLAQVSANVPNYSTWNS